MIRLSRIAILSFTLACAAAPRAQENLELGKMWTLERPPLAYLKNEYGFAPTEQWFDRLRLASIRFGSGCSSSFVSPKGLIMTNHHCVRGDIAKAQGGFDWVKDGFYARSLADEVKLPGLTVQQLVATEDVTAQMNEGIDAGDDDATVAAKRKANEAAVLVKAATDHPDTQPQVVTLFQGAMFELYVYKAYDDIRLVCAPHLQTSHFGGDPDNFCYPRYGIDFSFVRAYANDEPIDTSENYFRWCQGGVKEGELVFVTGNPGTTKRLLTRAQMEYLRDWYHPIVQGLIDARLRVRRDLVDRKPSLEKALRTEILSWENTQKAYQGYWDGLREPSLMAQKEAAEAAFQKRVQNDPELAKDFGDVWDRLADVAERRAALEPKIRFQNTGGHPVLALALDVVRAGRATDAAKQEAARARARSQAGAVAAISELTRGEFIDHLERARQWLPADDAWLAAVIGDRTPTEVADLLENSELRDPQKLDALLGRITGVWDGPMPPELAMAETILPMLESNGAENNALASIEEAQGARIGRALFGAYGTSVSPDATLTLRFSDGVVKGYKYNGTVAPHLTTFYGLYARATEFGNRHPFDLPQIWLDREDKIEMSKPVDLVSTNDIIGGNSGSPLVNANLEIVGLIFDGNIEMLPNRYVYRSEIARCVSVHVDGIMEALKKIYDADRIVAELLGEEN